MFTDGWIGLFPAPTVNGAKAHRRRTPLLCCLHRNMWSEITLEFLGLSNARTEPKEALACGARNCGSPAFLLAAILVALRLHSDGLELPWGLHLGPRSHMDGERS